MTEKNLDNICINTIRFLSADAVETAKSGHPGMPMGAAAAAYTLWTKIMKYNPENPDWPDRDRFVLSAGHGSALLYSLLFLTGFDLSLQDLKNFRQLGSKTPGHPENFITPGVEATTGPLGQGFGNAVGMAIAESMLAARFNRDELNIVDHYTFALASDGDIMEGISSEAASLAGHLKLGKLIVLYDNNNITIDGSTDLALSEDRMARFDAYGWQTFKIDDGNDIDAIEKAILKAKEDTKRPSFIDISTHIGFGSPNKQDTADAHGSPLGEEELRLTKRALGWPEEELFHVPPEALSHFREMAAKGEGLEKDWSDKFDMYRNDYPELANEFNRTCLGELPQGYFGSAPTFKTDDGPIATRAASGKILNAIAGSIPELCGGSADLAPSNKSLINESKNFQADNRHGRNIRFGVREHAMGAICNGLALHKGIRPYGATFLIFSDYMRPSIRLAALSGLPVIYIFTHDSIGLGEDGPTHQPVEHLLSLRAMPNLTVIRPADANETVSAWKLAVESSRGPTAIVLSRQKLPVLDIEEYPQLPRGVSNGGYILYESSQNGPDIALVGSGAEVHLLLEAAKKLEKEKIYARVVSMPSWEIFMTRPESYRKELFNDIIPVLAVEAGVTLGWRSYVRSDVHTIGIDRFGASAPAGDLFEKFGFTAENVADKVREILKKND